MYYKMLSEQYVYESKIIRHYIKKLRQEYQSLESEDLQLKYRIKTLYSMYLELNQTARYLKYKSEVMSKNGK